MAKLGFSKSAPGSDDPAEKEMPRPDILQLIQLSDHADTIVSSIRLSPLPIEVLQPMQASCCMLVQTDV